MHCIYIYIYTYIKYIKYDNAVIIYAIISQLPDIFWEFRSFFSIYISKRCCMVVVTLFDVFFASTIKIFNFVYIWPLACA